MRRVIFILGFMLLLAALPAASAAEATETTPPDVSCSTADGQWHAADVSIACAATDSGSGLAIPADASFSLTTSVAAGQETADGMTDSRQVCDVDANCATAGPIGGNMVDKKAPVATCGAADGNWHPNNVQIACSSSEGGSGLANAGQASLALPTSVPAGVETADAMTNSASVCDGVGNCASAGPVGGHKVDRKAPHNPTIVQGIDHRIRKWSRDRRISMKWRGASDAASRLDGYSISWSHRSGSHPDTAKDREQGEHRATSPRLSTGKWWFHLRTRDNVGNWAGAVNRGPYFIDVTRPGVRARSASGKVGHSATLRYQTGDNTHQTREHITVRRSGSLVKAWSRRMGKAFFDRTQTVSFTPHAAGSYSFCVQAWDPAGNTRRDCASVSVKAPPPPPPTQPASNCHPSYKGACLDPNASDYDCAGGSGDGPKYTGTVQVVGYDEYGLDADGDGWGCE